jgi:hypothetical protein
MATDIVNPNALVPDGSDDCQALMQSLLTRTRLDPETYRRIRERSEQIIDSIRRQHGTVDAAVDLIRKTRDEP